MEARAQMPHTLLGCLYFLPLDAFLSLKKQMSPCTSFWKGGEWKRSAYPDVVPVISSSSLFPTRVERLLRLRI
jgi:hypothetical protein